MDRFVYVNGSVLKNVIDGLNLCNRWVKNRTEFYAGKVEEDRLIMRAGILLFLAFKVEPAIPLIDFDIVGLDAD